MSRQKQLNGDSAHLKRHTQPQQPHDVKLARQAAHDMRAPLAAVRIFSQILSQRIDGEREIFQSMASSLDRLSAIAASLDGAAKNFLEVRSNSSQSPGQVFLKTLLERITTEKRIQFREGKPASDIHTYLGQLPGSAVAGMPQGDLLRVLSNLIDNAVEAHGEERGLVHVEAAAVSARLVRIVIEDHGRGIPERLLPLLGKERVTFGKRSGSGLGLYHAQQTLTLYNGSMRVCSRVGGGTKIVIQIPTRDSLH